MPSTDVLSRPGTLWLDATRPVDGEGASLLFHTPRNILTATVLTEVPDVLAEVDARVSDGAYVAGYLSYEAGYAFEDTLSPPATSDTLAWFGVYDAPEVLDSRGTERLLGTDPGTHWRVGGLRLEIERMAYRDAVEAVRARIREGDVYQINFTDRVSFDFEGSAQAFYGALRRRQRVPYGALLNLGDTRVLSLSPELFFRRSEDRLVTRPMKGTVRRGRTREEDDWLRAWLAADPKSRAENLMIVDLLRNDLARVCRPGTVQVPALFTVETYETLLQMTSTVQGRLRPGIRYADLFRALFPCGSVTGAPKIRAMRRIRELERQPRGVYCGAIGYIAPDDQAAFNVAIRTIVLRDGRGVMGTGSGIVWDSDADAEYDECRLKARFLVAGAGSDDAPGFRLIETMRAEDGQVPLLDLHVQRLAASARNFGFAFDETIFRGVIAGCLSEKPSADPLRVRVTLDHQGTLSCTATSLPKETPALRRVAIVPERLDSTDPFLYHKTTRRTLYERVYRRVHGAGFDEALFLNERGEVAEGSRTNIFVHRGDAWLTPPVSSGLLDGIYRRHLLDTRSGATEAVLHADDLLTPGTVWLCNAVWGLRPVEVVVYEGGNGE